MFGPPSDLTLAGVQSLAVALIVFGLGYLIVDAIFGRRDIDPIVRVGLVFPALLGASLVLMVVHVASGGRLFAHPGAVRTVTVLTFVALAMSRFMRQRRYPGEFPKRAVFALHGITLVALFIWGRSVFELLPAAKGDTIFHMGWAASLLNGEKLPTNALTGEIPNAYPWLFHAIVAWLSALTPGGRSFHALGPMQLLQVTGGVTTLFALGYTLWDRWVGGISTALLGALTGGFGFLVDKPRLVYEVRPPGSIAIARTYGDLMAVRSYNLSFHNLAPVFPRDVSYALFPALLLLFVVGLRTGDRLYLVAAGFVLGFLGLAGGEAFFVGAVVTALFVASAAKLGRIRTALHIGIPATLVYALWLGPLVFNYFKYGGFFDLSDEPVVLTPLQVLGSWGVVTPLALVGVALLVGRLRRDEGALVAVLSLVAAGAMLLAVVAAGAGVGGGLETLGRAHRYWPVFYLTAAICGGFALFWILERAARAHVVAAIAVFVTVSVVALASPLIGAGQVKEELLRSAATGNPTRRAALRGQENWLTALAPAPGRRCTIAVPKEISIDSYAFTGYRHVLYAFSNTIGNMARVRWREIYLDIPTEADRLEANSILVSARGSADRYREIVDRFQVDRVLVPETALGSPALEGFKIEETDGTGEDFGVVHTGECSTS